MCWRPRLDWTTVELGDAVVESQPEGILVDLGADGGGFQDFSADSGLAVDPSSSAPATDASFAAARWTGEIQYRQDDPQAAVWVDLHIAATVEPAAEAFVEGADQGVVTWTLLAAEIQDDDPAPGVPRDAGFLAHGCAADDAGEPSSCGGHVSFTVEPAVGLAEGTPITNDADIAFDGLEPVLTDPSSTVTVGSQPPGIPIFPSPADAVPGDPPVPGEDLLLSWEAPFAVTEDVYLWSEREGDSRPASPEQAVVWEPGLAGSRYPEGGGTFSLPAGESWRWQVVAHNERGESTEGPVWRFTTGAAFKRGDADGSGALQITDAIFALGFLFLGGEPPGCLETADADDSGNLNITDPSSR